MKFAFALFFLIAGCGPDPTITGEAYLTNPSGGAEKQAGLLVYLLAGDPLGGLDSLVEAARTHKDSLQTAAIETLLRGTDSIRTRQKQLEARYKQETQGLMNRFSRQYGNSTAMWPADAFQAMLDIKRGKGSPVDTTGLEMARLQKDIAEQVKTKTQHLTTEFDYSIVYLIMSAVIDSARTGIEGQFEIAMPVDLGEYHLFAERGNRAWYVPVKIEKKASVSISLAPYNIGAHPLSRLEF